MSRDRAGRVAKEDGLKTDQAKRQEIKLTSRILMPGFQEMIADLLNDVEELEAEVLLGQQSDTPVVPMPSVYWVSADKQHFIVLSQVSYVYSDRAGSDVYVNEYQCKLNADDAKSFMSALKKHLG